MIVRWSRPNPLQICGATKVDEQAVSEQPAPGADRPLILDIIGKGLTVADCVDAHFRTPEERQRQIESEPLPANIYTVLAEAAADVPDQVAWNFFEEGVVQTYCEVKAAVDRLSASLHELGISKGTHVGVMLPNVPQFPTTWLALGRLGAIMVPINDRYSPRELDYIVNDGDVEWLVIGADMLACLDGMEKRPEALDDSRVIVVGDAPGRAYHSFERVFADGDPDFVPAELPGLQDLMNIQYTSGTTGFPKGCMLRHFYWVGIAKVAARRDGLVYKNILAATPYYYMDPQWLTLMAFYHRGTLFAARRQSSSRFMEWVHKYKIHFCLFNEMFYRMPPAPYDRDNELRRVNVYGLRKAIHADLQVRFNTQAREAFGMTEVGTTLFMPLEASDMTGSGSCGVPCAFREARVVDENGVDVARGSIGELVVRGPNIMLGYYKKPDANKAAFFGEWFRTGDLFRQDEQGYFYIVGRIKDMIRRSGENISAREVEEVIARADGVSEVAAIGVPHETRGEEVKVYVVAKDPAAPPAPDSLIAFARTQLAPFKVPRYVEFIEAFPRTPSEKIAKNVLKASKEDHRAGCWDAEAAPGH
jgi:acyl-CoA synthetase (AMP-forming)/AMP-acid ligase II